MKRALLALPLLALTLTGCGGSGSKDAVTKTVTASPSGAPADSQSAQTPPPNPVDILKKIKGCQFEADASRGKIDFQGNMYAECMTGANGYKNDYNATGNDYTFTARTGATRPQPAGMEHVQDGKFIIYGDTWYVIGGPTFGNDTLKPGDAEKYAKMLGGKIAKSDADLAAQPPEGDS